MKTTVWTLASVARSERHWLPLWQGQKDTALWPMRSRGGHCDMRSWSLLCTPRYHPGKEKEKRNPKSLNIYLRETELTPTYSFIGKKSIYLSWAVFPPSTEGWGPQAEDEINYRKLKKATFPFKMKTHLSVASPPLHRTDL